ncbi:MAG: hypothetical protein WA139_00505 [Candidatus Aenigmatarchaeota archaeon]
MTDLYNGMKVIGTTIPEEQKSVEEMLEDLQNRQTEYANGKILKDKTTIIDFKRNEIRKAFDECITHNVEVGFPIFSSGTVKYFGDKTVGDDEGVSTEITGRRNSDDDDIGFLHSHVRHEAYPSQSGKETDLEEMSGRGRYWLIMGINPDAKKAVLRGYHQDESIFLTRSNLHQVPERIIFKTEDGVSSEIRYDKGKIDYLFEEAENSSKIIENHLRFLEL